MPDGPSAARHPRPRVLVIGAGIAGLTAAWSLVNDHGVTDVTVVEAGGHVGGAIASGSVAGVAHDTGAEAVLARRPEALALATEVGLADHVVAPATTSARVLVGGSLRAMPEATVMGIPTDVGAVGRSGVLDATALARLPLDHVLPAQEYDGDVSVGDLVGRRLGPQVVERLVGPLLGGVYAGRAMDLSLQACLPAVFAAVQTERSLIAAARTVRDAVVDPDAPALAGISGGVARLPAAVHDRLHAAGVTVVLGARVNRLERVDGAWRTDVAGQPDFDAVILAVPAFVAAGLLRRHALGPSIELAQIDYASVATVSLAYEPGRVRGPDIESDDAHGIRPGASGFVVATTERVAMKAATYSGQKWEWLGAAAADAGVAIVRTSYGRIDDGTALLLDDDELAALAQTELGSVLRLGRDRAVDSLVTRWPDALPQYVVGHVDRVASIRAGIAALPGVAVCGAAYDGIGIAACIASARRAAADVLGVRHSGTITL